jgi:hypothetical protein
MGMPIRPLPFVPVYHVLKKKQGEPFQNFLNFEVVQSRFFTIGHV